MNFEIPEFGRCCFCFPLRRGIVTFGYINIVWSSLMLFTTVHYNPWVLSIFGFFAQAYTLGWEIQIAYYVFDIIFSILLIIGAHLNKSNLLLAFIYYSISTVTILFIFKTIDLISYVSFGEVITFVAFLLSGSFNLFIAMICWSLIKKIQRETPTEGYQNPLQQFVDGEMKADNTENTDTNEKNYTIQIAVPSNSSKEEEVSN